jgi:hypothetical protein
VSGRPVSPGKPVGWFTRNTPALLAVLVLLPATLGIMFANQWIGRLEERPSRPVEATIGETVDYANAAWTIEATDRVPGSSAAGLERGLPAGTDLIVVTVGVSPAAPGADGLYDLCTVRLEESGDDRATRTWSNAARGTIRLTGDGPVLTSCSSESSSPYSFDAEFVVPTETGDFSDLTAGIVVPDALPEYARFALG